MLASLKMRFWQAFETAKANGLKALVRDYVYIGRKAIPVEKDLDTLKPIRDSKQFQDFMPVEITEDFLYKNTRSYQLRNRKLKAFYYLAKGYHGYGMMRHNELIADIWYWSPQDTRTVSPHADLKWLRLECESDQIYAFDMFLDPSQRSNNLAAHFFTLFLHSLRKKGVLKVYGYFWADNIPALWVHRLMGWRELGSITMSRILFFRKTVNVAR